MPSLPFTVGIVAAHRSPESPRSLPGTKKQKQGKNMKWMKLHATKINALVGRLIPYQNATDVLSLDEHVRCETEWRHGDADARATFRTLWQPRAFCLP